MLAPALGFTDVGFMKYTLVADRYQHIALIGAIALAAAAWSVWQRQARVPAGRAANGVALRHGRRAYAARLAAKQSVP